ncbi:hypothetical protein QVD17_05034 [Tagetes erecta]|uniref:HTH La-type RNA-binding domain-containing protein n=1 Tax=Tagetes erecta TaxID=13708 RepID=A0AAD8PA73_TARER|nr:hypothetical protein QVD17_05034 [Tagetes erecta]
MAALNLHPKDTSTSPPLVWSNVLTPPPPPDHTSTPVDQSQSAIASDAINKPAWNKPSNGVVLMDAHSWPALGDTITTKSVAKSFSSDSISDQSLQVGPNSPISSHKLASVTPNSIPNHVTHSGQRDMKRGGGSLSSNGGVSKPDTATVDSVTKDHMNKESPRGGYGFGSQSNGQQNSYRRGNGGLYSRGGGSYNNSYGGKSEQGQGRGNQEWNQHRNFNNRDTNIQSQRGGYRRGGYVRPSVHNSTPFIHPPMPLHGRSPFGNNVMYPDVASAMMYFQGPAPPMVPGPRYFPFPDPLHGTIVKQIEYYFSNENLVRDTYLRRNMDEQGWVHVSLIAGFKKVSSLTDNVQLILDVMRQSTVVEVQGDKMRRRNDWMKWLMPPAVQDSLASQFQGITLDSRSSSGELSNQLQQGGGERAAVA